MVWKVCLHMDDLRVRFPHRQTHLHHLEAFCKALASRALPPLLSPLFLLLGAGLLLRCVEASATVGSWPPRGSHRASATFTMAVAVPWAPAPTVSLIDGGRRIKNIARKRSLSGDTPGGRCCLSFPMRTLGLRPCISTGRRSSSK
jgi:hypothetical protein